MKNEFKYTEQRSLDYPLSKFEFTRYMRTKFNNTEQIQLNIEWKGGSYFFKQEQKHCTLLMNKEGEQ